MILRSFNVRFVCGSKLFPVCLENNFRFSVLTSKPGFCGKTQMTKMKSESEPSQPGCYSSILRLRLYLSAVSTRTTVREEKLALTSVG